MSSGSNIIGQYTCLLTNNAQELKHPTDLDSSKTQRESVNIFCLSQDFNLDLVERWAL
jgi:hypothetical protein